MAERVEEIVQHELECINCYGIEGRLTAAERRAEKYFSAFEDSLKKMNFLRKELKALENANSDLGSKLEAAEDTISNLCAKFEEMETQKRDSDAFLNPLYSELEDLMVDSKTQAGRSENDAVNIALHEGILSDLHKQLAIVIGELVSHEPITQDGQDAIPSGRPIREEANVEKKATHVSSNPPGKRDTYASLLESGSSSMPLESSPGEHLDPSVSRPTEPLPNNKKRKMATKDTAHWVLGLQSLFKPDASESMADLTTSDGDSASSRKYNVFSSHFPRLSTSPSKKNHRVDNAYDTKDRNPRKPGKRGKGSGRFLQYEWSEDDVSKLRYGKEQMDWCWTEVAEQWTDGRKGSNCSYYYKTFVNPSK